MNTYCLGCDIYPVYEQYLDALQEASEGIQDQVANMPPTTIEASQVVIAIINRLPQESEEVSMNCTPSIRQSIEENAMNCRKCPRLDGLFKALDAIDSLKF